MTPTSTPLQDRLRHPRLIALAALDRTLDGALGGLPMAERRRVSRASNAFLAAYRRKADRVLAACEDLDCWLAEAPERLDDARRAAAAGYLPALGDDRDSRRLLDGHLRGQCVPDLFDALVRRRLADERQWAALKAWLEAPVGAGG